MLFKQTAIDLGTPSTHNNDIEKSQETVLELMVCLYPFVGVQVGHAIVAVSQIVRIAQNPQ